MLHQLVDLRYALIRRSNEVARMRIPVLRESLPATLRGKLKEIAPEESWMRYALKRIAADPDHPLSKDAAWQEALKNCLGEEALDLQTLADRKNQTLGGNVVPMGLGDFFFSPSDPLHPDYEDDDDDFDDEDDEDNY